MGLRQQARRTVLSVLVVVGAVAMGISTQLDRIWWILVFFLVGMTCLSLLLLQLGDYLHDRLVVEVPKWWLPTFGAGALAGLGLLAASIAWQLDPFLAIVGMVVLTVGLTGMFLWLSRRNRPPGLVRKVIVGPDGERPVDPPLPQIGVGSGSWYGFEAMAVGIGLLLISDGTASLFGLVAWMAGLVTVKIASLPYLESRGDQIGRTVRILIDVALVGLFLLFAGAFTSNSVLLLIGLSIVTAALSMIGIGILQIKCSSGKVWWVMGLSLVAMTGIWLWMAVATHNPGLAFVLGLMVALAGGFFVLRGEGIVLLMLAGYVIGWGLVDRAVPLEDSVAQGVVSKPVQIVALGDSFISGEGAEKFFEGTNDAGGNQCRRAPMAHPYLVAAALEINMSSLACSGAKIADLTMCGQMWPDGRRCRIDSWDDAISDYVDEPAGPLPQLVTAKSRNLTSSADIVMLSIGGNDVGFSSIVKACLLPKGCDERREIWLDSVDLLGPQLDELYVDLAEAFPNATVMVMPYPMIVDAEPDNGCDLGLSLGEREFVVDFIQKLDATIEQAAARAGFVYIGEAKNAYDTFQLCDGRAAANHLRLVPPAGSKLGRYSPSTWIPGSMHPNELGHELTASVAVCPVAQQLRLTPVSGNLTDDREFDCKSAPPPAPASDPSGEDGAATYGDTADGAAEACEAALNEVDGGSVDDGSAAACQAVGDAVADVVDQQFGELAAEVAVVTEEIVSDDEWIRVELFRTIRALALPLVLLLAAGIVFAWGFVQLDNPFSRFMRQYKDRGPLRPARRSGLDVDTR